MAQSKKSKSSSDKTRVALAFRELESAISHNAVSEEVAVIKNGLTNLIGMAEERITELKRQRIEAIEAEIALLNQERESLQ